MPGDTPDEEEITLPEIVITAQMPDNSGGGGSGPFGNWLGPDLCDTFAFLPNDVVGVQALADYWGDLNGDEDVVANFDTGEDGVLDVGYGLYDAQSGTVTSVGETDTGIYCVTAPWDGPWPEPAPISGPLDYALF